MLMSLMMGWCVARDVPMAMEKNNHDDAMKKYRAQFLVSEVGARSLIAPTLVVVEPKNVCTPSPNKLLMVAKSAQKNAEQRTSLNAA